MLHRIETEADFDKIKLKIRKCKDNYTGPGLYIEEDKRILLLSEYNQAIEDKRFIQIAKGNLNLKIIPVERLLGISKDHYYLVNYIKHNMTIYDRYIQKVGHNPKAYKLLKTRVLNEIAAAYPILKKNCDYQLKLLEKKFKLLEKI